MENTTRRWLTGCGVGCAVAIAVVALMIGGGYLGVLPAATVASLDPFGDRLSASYSANCHPVELAVQEW